MAFHQDISEQSYSPDPSSRVGSGVQTSHWIGPLGLIEWSTLGKLVWVTHGAIYYYRLYFLVQQFVVN